MRSFDAKALVLLLVLGHVVLAATACGGSTADAEKKTASPRLTSRVGDPVIALELVATGLGRITDIVPVPGDARSFVVTSQDGAAQLVRLREGSAVKPAATVWQVDVETKVEMGLLSMAFHPGYEQNGRVFAHYNPADKMLTRVVELALPKAELGKGTPKQKRVLLELEQPYANHNGGELAFGPDGKLYLGLGDGGMGGDPLEAGQRLDTYLGKILRFDVDAADFVPKDNPFVGRANAKPLIFAYGLRNPWKLAFAPDGRLIVADVGQNKWEEIDLVRAGDNMGWDEREAFHCFEPAEGCKREGLVDPIFEYGRDDGVSVTGGEVYTGSALPALRNRYVFADYGSGRFWALELPDTQRTRAKADVIGVFELNATSFARGPDGELYVGDYSSGGLYRLVRP